MDSGGTLHVEVVAADRTVWTGEATSVIARTTEGDIGILYNHEPLLAALVPCAAEVITESGERAIIAIDGGFLAVDQNRVSLLAQYARLSQEVDSGQAETDLREAQHALEQGDTSEENMHRLHAAQAQLRAKERHGS